MTIDAPLGVRKFRAQDRYAQEILTWLWENKDTEPLIEENDGAYFYRGSLHQLVRRLRPSAQAGDVVNIMREFGAVGSAGHGLWELRRKEVFQDEEGNPVRADIASYGHDPKYVVLQRQITQQGQRIIELETLMTNLTTVVVNLAREKNPELVVEEGADKPKNLPEVPSDLLGERE